MTVTVGGLANVPAPGDPIRSPWAQDVSRIARHVFASKAAIDAATAGWSGLANGAFAIALDTGIIWNRIGGAWVEGGIVTPPHCRLTHSANQGIASGSIVPIVFDTETVDVGGLHTPASNTRITIPTGLGGWWTFGGNVVFATGATGYRELLVRLNGGATRLVDAATPATGVGAGDVPTLAVTAAAQLAAGDYLELCVAAGAATAVNVAAAYSPVFWAHRLAA